MKTLRFFFLCIVSGLIFVANSCFAAAPIIQSNITINGFFNVFHLVTTVNPGGLPTTVVFHWGPSGSTPLPSQLSAIQSPLSGTGDKEVAISLTPLDMPPGQPYDIQIVATNSDGSVTGEIDTIYIPPAKEPDISNLSVSWNNSSAKIDFVFENVFTQTEFLISWVSSDGTVSGQATPAFSPFFTPILSALIPFSVNVPNLDQNKRYNFTVTATNTYGVDSLSEVLISRPPPELSNLNLVWNNSSIDLSFDFEKNFTNTDLFIDWVSSDGTTGQLDFILPATTKQGSAEKNIPNLDRSQSYDFTVTVKNLYGENTKSGALSANPTTTTVSVFPDGGNGKQPLTFSGISRGVAVLSDTFSTETESLEFFYSLNKFKPGAVVSYVNSLGKVTFLGYRSGRLSLEKIAQKRCPQKFYWGRGTATAAQRDTRQALFWMQHPKLKPLFVKNKTKNFSRFALRKPRAGDELFAVLTRRRTVSNELKQYPHVAMPHEKKESILKKELGGLVKLQIGKNKISMGQLFPEIQ
ncbi:hypothetical protein HN954_04045 [bacterium]|nr:hypothetical protein [bacterium]MBT6831747.1 hypothetical protein [bacterium]MBT6996570.1 hypothetical protein [bacterium]MBT7772896.1 hypothetical protein [bacterium]